MAEAFLRLEQKDRLDALEVAAFASGRPVHLLEKDVWVVWALKVMFSEPFGKHLVFKGGTSLSKAYGAIRRFSEDVDLTYDIRAIAPELTGDQSDPLPKSSSQERKWSDHIRKRLSEWVASTALSAIKRAIAVEQVPATAEVDPNNPHAVLVNYESVSVGSGYVAPVVLLEFGARSTGEPCEVRFVQCDAAQHLPALEFPTAEPRVMRAERTFWEKATAIHVLCSGGKIRADRFSRHWYDLVQLDNAGFVATALVDRHLASQVAEHKSWFFEEKVAGKPISYEDAVNGELRLVPEGTILDALKVDYQKMVDDGLFLDTAESFEVLLERCRQIEERANAAGRARSSTPPAGSTPKPTGH